MSAEPDEQGLLAAVTRYERALTANDVAELDALFAGGDATLRADGTAALVGHDHIARFRARRGGAPARWLRRVHVRWISPDDALVVAEADRVDGHGLQTQWWRRQAGVWTVHAAHVSGGPSPARPGAGPDEQEDPATWRVRFAPEPAAAGPLAGLGVAVKDLIAVAGHAIGGGVPAWREQARPEPANAPALQRLLDAGAHVAGIAQTDELAFSLMGVNEHSGTPVNVNAPGRVPGGSTSGPAAAVAAGTADLGLGTDTAGSLRVPGSYCGLHAWRPTHGVVPVDGVLPLAPAFDTVGLLTRDGATLRRAGLELLRQQPTGRAPQALLRSRTLMALATPETALAVEAALAALSVATGIPVRDVEVDPAAPAAWTTAFRTVQAAQAWAAHGAFLSANPDAVSPSVAARFRAGAAVTDEQVGAARQESARVSAWLAQVLQQGWLCLPSTSTPAPRVDSTGEKFELARGGTLQLTTLASQTGVPALNLPWARVGTLPVGLCVLAPRGADADLLDLLRVLGPA
ncbi:AtzH-like domain-containing protein [Kineococcus rhizosphaerae]|uniref:Asp-tRNA(Asn)/Glu-tRNA(Gln) amidotransferase A subunit family amidase n=1 Tax=Kineococcus rhizosphaerae TaxID=559628 RepID=A0A2T0QY43_9ACTN|nr:AtzH-like domain-containing protein [Kineococcus rhizosphaerae]PRY11094.1 Asp-tRNA(Asn)/Glu-tRNA(Gln) amidotransferase A subunit family amidase [Kineococcus rhizosphaerae]